jgi:hypothetical protein
MKNLIVVPLALCLLAACSGAKDTTTPPTPTCEQHSHQGCCSGHGGVKTYDPSDCRIICADGTYSPTCYW